MAANTGREHVNTGSVYTRPITHYAPLSMPVEVQVLSWLYKTALM